MDVIKVEKRNEQAKANQLRWAGTSGPLLVFAPLIPAHAGRGNAMRTQKWNQAKK